MKELLDKLHKKYENKDFIKNDPIQFPHRFKNKKDIEISAFISSMFAYGSRKVFIQKLDNLFKIMENEPYNFILNYKKYSYLLNDFSYRFQTSDDLKTLFLGLFNLYSKNDDLENLFSSGFYNVYKYFEKYNNNSIGFRFLISNPKNNGANKRYNMFLRWMIRNGEVDFGIWNFIDKSNLLIPLDTHVATLSRHFNLLMRKSNDIKAVIELTNKLKEFDEKDPIKYDFALFGLGVDESINTKEEKALLGV